MADAIDVSIVHDRWQPGPQVTTTAETLLLFVGPQQRVIVNEIFRIIRIAHERARIAPKRCKLADDIEWAGCERRIIPAVEKISNKNQ
ncbi:hypothetical protein FHX09_004042 [Rhizobium sp. BK538]|nr:hypothetical protein [Rhizobium sp. BK060]MBB4170164.1 hypothetical protein [Rhizobium sp. BK538]